VSSQSSYGIKLLGTPLGSNVFVTNWLDAKFAALESEAEEYKKLDNPQLEWLVLHYVFSSKINYLYRTVSPQFMLPYSFEFENLIESMVRHIIRDDSISFSLLSRLPITAGGIGIGHHESINVSAYLASHIASSQYIFKHKILKRSKYDFRMLNNTVKTYLESKYQYFPSDHPTHSVNIVSFSSFAKNFNAENPRNLQEDLYRQLVDCYSESVKIDVHKNSSKANVQCYNSITFPHAGKFLLAIPINPQLTFSPHSFRIAIKNRLIDVPQIPSHPKIYCNCFKKSLLDTRGNHLMTCVKNSCYRNIRHNNLVKVFSELASAAGICNRIEPQRSLPDPVSLSQKRPDIILYQSDIHNRSNVSIDVSITHPIGDHHSISVESSISRRSQEKLRKYMPSCQAQGNMAFEPFILDTFGRFNDNVDLFIKKCSQVIAEKTFKPYSLIKHRWVTKISSVLQNSNSYFFNHYYHLINPMVI
jgi:hypothetical protein